MINLIWAAMILVGIITALLTGHMEDVNAGIIDAGSDAVSLCITMLGIVTMWCGDVGQRRSDVGRHAGELSGFERIVRIGEFDHQHDGSHRTRYVFLRIAVPPLRGIDHAVGQREGDVREQTVVFIDRRARSRITEILRHRNGDIDRNGIDVRNGRQHRKLGTHPHVIARMGVARSDDAVDRSIDTGIAHLQPCVAHLLLGRTHGSLRGDVFGRILVELRLTDGVDTRQRHGAFVVVAC